MEGIWQLSAIILYSVYLRCFYSTEFMKYLIIGTAVCNSFSIHLYISIELLVGDFLETTTPQKR